MESKEEVKTEVLAHLTRVFGQPSQVVKAKGGVEVWMWLDPEDTQSGWLCTVGMSQKEQTVPSGQGCLSKEPRTELFCYCQPDHAEVLANILLDLARYPFEKKTFLFWWQTVSLGRALLPGSSVRGIFLSMPPFDLNEVTFSIQGRRIDLVWVVPVTQSEMDLFASRGAEALERALEDAEADVADLFRQAVA